VFNTPYGKEIRKMLPAGVTEFSKLGRGTFGVVYLSCVDSKNPKTCSVFKVERIPKNYEDMKDVEPAMQRKFANHGLAPKVRNVRFTRNNKGSLYRIIEMEKIAGTLASYLKIKRPLRVLEMIAEWVSDLIESMCKYGLIHGDMHLDNIGYNLLEDKMFYGKAYPVAMNLQLIDFGWACCANKAVPCNPRMELLQLARTADIGIEQSNGDHLRDMFLEMYNERYRPHVSGDQKSLEKAYEKLFYAYEEDVYDKQHV
jgi:tRNA A-37 threonylcarbamoyl transferase component Bud32